MSSKPPSSSSFFDFLKPRRNEAVLKLRNSVVALVVLFALTNLSPLPSLWSSTRLAWGVLTRAKSVDVGYGFWTLSVAQGIVCGALLLTIIQAAFALKYPRESLPPLASPSKAIHTSATPASQKKLAFKTPLANSTIQKQKAFPLSASSSYASSPVSTPSRTLKYTLPATASPFNSSLNSSLATSIPPSPSPLLSSPLAAYRGKHSQSIGHALTGSFLGKVSHGDDSDDD